MTRYRATAEWRVEWDVEFNDDEIEDGDDPQIAAEEFLLAVPMDARGDGDLDVTVLEVAP